jgi:hypothetical protein
MRRVGSAQSGCFVIRKHTLQSRARGASQIYYDESRTYSEARLHPYAAGSGDQSGYVDFKAFPVRIAEALEDFRAFDSTVSVQTFYPFIRWANGVNSHLET